MASLRKRKPLSTQTKCVSSIRAKRKTNVIDADPLSKKRRILSRCSKACDEDIKACAKDSNGDCISNGVCYSEPVYYLRRRDIHVKKEGSKNRMSLRVRDGRAVQQCSQSINDIRHHCKEKMFISSRSAVSMDSRSCTLSCAANSCISDLDEEVDDNDSSCQICGDGGQLILCDSCPASYHMECLHLDSVPEGDWHCPSCRCCKCGGLGKSQGYHKQIRHVVQNMKTMISCAQCHASCHRGCSPVQDFEGNWFCRKQCKHVFVSLRELVGRKFHIHRGLSWMLIRSFKEDNAPTMKKSVTSTFEKYLSEALNVLHESFNPVLDTETDIDFLSHATFNRKSKLRRLDCQGFYTLLLMKGEQLVSVATVRIHGDKLAEMPFIATRNQFRNTGMCRLLMAALETMLRRIGIRKLVLPSVSELLETWTKTFAFKPMVLSDRMQILDFVLLSFPGTTLLQKNLHSPEEVHFTMFRT